MRRSLLAVVLVACGGADSPAPAADSTLVGAATVAEPEACAHDSTWLEPTAPFKIHGNTYSVGPKGLGIFLITAPTGHVLIDGGVPGGAGIVEANLKALDIDPRDIKWIAVSHAHCDHAGAIADLVKVTGAEVIAGAGDVALLARGGMSDPQYGDRFPYPPVVGVRGVTDGEVLRLGSLELTAHLTPGHTAGNVTWAWTSCENDRCLQLVDVGSLSAPDYVLTDSLAHPTLVSDYEGSFAKVVALRCDLALAPHPGMVDFWDRVTRREAGETNAMLDGTLCAGYAEYARESFRKELARQRGQ